MTITSIPTCFFPSTVLFIANKQDNWLKPIFSNNRLFTTCVFGSVNDAIDCLKRQYCDADKLSSLCTDHSLAACSAPIILDPSSQGLVMMHAEMYNPMRFAEISVVVIDATMLGINDFDFCHLLAPYHNKKIAIINSDLEDTARVALNKGIIDAYFVKDNASRCDELMRVICYLQHSYFQHMSQVVLNLLSLNEPECLQNIEFVNYFNNICAHHDIVEYYLADLSGGFLLINADGQVSLLLIKRESDMPLIAEFAAKHGANASVLESIKSGKQIPGMLANEYVDPNMINWEHVLVAAKRKFFNDVYETAYVSGHSWYDVNYHKSCSYSLYLNRLSAEEHALVN